MPPKNVSTAKNAQTTDKASSSKTKSGASGNTGKISTSKIKPASAIEKKDATGKCQSLKQYARHSLQSLKIYILKFFN